ncbi:hypothetical protein HID58_080122, partial [Brassica napus]
FNYEFFPKMTSPDVIEMPFLADTYTGTDGNLFTFANNRAILFNYGAPKGSPKNPVNSRFESLNPNTIPRMYHSTAILLRDGRVLVRGSNPHAFYSFTRKTPKPPPKIMSPTSQSTISYGMNLKVKLKVAGKVKGRAKRLLVLDNVRVKRTSSVFGALFGKSKKYEVQVKTPRSANIAPPGYYMMFVVNQNIPSEGIWVRLQ